MKEHDATQPELLTTYPRRFRLKLFITVLFLLLLNSVVLAGGYDDDDDDHRSSSDWPFFNYDRESTGYLKTSGDLSVKAIKKRGLRLKWTFGENIGIQAPAVVHDGIAYVLEDGPNIHAVKVKNGKAKWSKSVPDDISPQVSAIVGIDVIIDRVRSTPVAVGDLLIMAGRNDRHFFNVFRDENGEIVAIGPCGLPIGGSYPGIDGCSPEQGYSVIENKGLEKQGGTFAFALNKHNGKVVWATQIDDDRLSIVTGSPMLDKKSRTVFFGTSSAQNFINMAIIRFTGLSEDDFELLIDNGQNGPTVPYAKVIPGDLNQPVDSYLRTDGLVIFDAGFFRGSVVALDTHTGRIKFKTYLTPGLLPGNNPDIDGEYSGVAAWSGFTYDAKRKLLYVPTGQNMHSPQGAKDCEIARRANGGIPTNECKDINKFPETITMRFDNHGNPYPVFADDNYPSSIVAIHTSGANEGRVAWAFTPYPYDTWTNNCAVWSVTAGSKTFSAPNAACPDPIGIDNDFGLSPTLITGNPYDMSDDVLIAVDKAGHLYKLDPDTGTVLQQKGIGVLATDSSVKLGSLVVDDKTIYLNSSLHINFDDDPIPSLNLNRPIEHKLCHSYEVPLNYTGPRPVAMDERKSTNTGNCRISPSNRASGNEPAAVDSDGDRVATGLLISALDRSNLDLKWQYTSPLPSDSQSGVTVVNDLVFVVDRLEAPDGTFRILNKRNGKSIWSYSGANLPNTQPTVSGNTILWGAGYFSADKFYAFELCPKGSKVDPNDITKCKKTHKYHDDDND